jgi:ABC-type multidrug transport system ATPase subunit
VRDVTFELADNEVLGIVGPNGAGKTTLIDLLATVLTPTSGSVFLAGIDAIAGPPAARRLIGYVPSGGRALFPRLTVLDNLRFFASLHGICGETAHVRAHRLLDRCGAAEVAGTRVDRISDGFASRVALARALLNDPALLLLDEPARSIDPVSRPSMLAVLRAFAREPGKAVVMVTHDLGDVFEICDRVAVMRAGQLVSLHDVGGTADRTRLQFALEGQRS